MDDIQNVRKMKDEENMSFRQIALVTGYSRNTISNWYKNKKFPKYKRTHTPSPIKDTIIEHIKRWIENDIDFINKHEKKNIRKASTIWADLKNMDIDCSYSIVRKYVSELKPKEIFIPLEYEAGMDMQVDWGFIDVRFSTGITIKVNFFVTTLPYSNSRFVYPYYKADQMSFFDGHIKAFNFFGGIPKRITYDNLSSAVKRVLLGTNRIEQDKMIHFKSFYGFQSNYCGVGKGNEKASVENGVGYAKRRFFGGEYSLKDFEELKNYLATKCENMLKDNHYKKKQMIEKLLNDEKEHFLKIPEIPYDCSQKIITKSNSTLNVQYDGVKYSIPSEYGQKTIILKATTDEIIIFYSENEIAKHKRYHRAFKKEVIDFKHYLPVILKKPRALDNAKCIKNAGFPQIFFLYLKELQIKNYNANKEMVKILMLHKYYDLNDIFFALEWGNLNKAYGYEAVIMTLKSLKKESIKIESINSSYPTINSDVIGLKKYDLLCGGTQCQC